MKTQSSIQYFGLITILLLSIFVVQLPAQTSGTLRGQVTDPSGAVVTAATVSAVSASGQTTTAVTSKQGAYVIQLPAGTYTVHATAKDFTPYEWQGITITGGQAETLDISLTIEVEKTQVDVEGQQQSVSVNSENNASMVVIKGKDLEALADDPDELEAQLLALAGPSAGPNGGQIYVDGFSNGTLPPKSSIREIRINQNPFSAQYDHVGFGRIEVLTKPGTDKFHGQFRFTEYDGALNAKNPFGPANPPDYSSQHYSGNFGGPLGKKASFFFDMERRNSNDAALVNATVLDAGFNPVASELGVLNPRVHISYSPRIDYQLTASNTLTARYSYSSNHDTNDGIGAFALPSQGFNSNSSEQNVQISDTQILSPRMVNETRFQYAAGRSQSQPQNLVLAPTINVPQAFIDGGSSHGIVDNSTDRYELQNYTSLQHGNHFVKFGGRLRTVQVSNSSTSNYNGTFTFASIAAYQITQQGLAQGLTPTQIRAAGGGPIQFVLNAGQPQASVSQADVGVYLEDDWHMRPKFTLSYGLRVESQGNISDHIDWAPRIGFAWGLSRGNNTPKTVLRAGYGLFYDRFSEGSVLQTIRLNGVLQQQFLVPLPDFYPNVPPVSTLAGTQIAATTYRISPSLQAPYLQQLAVGLERQFGKGTTTAVTYVNSRGLHQIFSDNINAPLPGTFISGNATSGVHPLGNIGNVYQYISEGVFKQNQLMVNSSVRLGARVSLNGNYTLSFANGNTSGGGSFPVNQYDLSAEYGRTSYDVRHRLSVFATVSLPHGVQLSPFMIANSGQPFNITLGRDLNGDSLVNDRPGIATDPTRVGVVASQWGLLDPNPIASEKLIPLNFGTTPSQLAFNLRVSKTFGFGRPSEGNSQMGRHGGGDHGGGGGGKGGAMRGGFGGGGGEHGWWGGGASSGKRYSLNIAVAAQNIFNNVNLGAPYSNLATGSRFGTFYQLANMEGFGGGRGGGGGPSPSNRTINFNLTFSF